MANAFKSYGTNAIGTSAVVAYTVPSVTSTTTIGLSLSNITSSLVTVSVSITKGSSGIGSGSTTEFYLIKDAPLLPGSTLVIAGGDQKVVLEALNTIKVKSSVASSVDCVMSVLEIS
jgi:hypothetical protein